MVYEKNVTVQNENGLHARPASLFVKEANKYQSEIMVVFDGKEVQAKSILGVMNLGAKKGSSIVLKAWGDDAPAAVEELALFIETKLVEEDI
ncbi:MAG: HPr family phosphocarrier protein [Alcaligenaceae bacterium]|jgi:phosphocarrier protein|nr:HPr family phosphocarrier protein [Alcaligenaceae bacterium]